MNCYGITNFLHLKQSLKSQTNTKDIKELVNCEIFVRIFLSQTWRETLVYSNI